jgi:hypothetical protein
MGGKSQTKCDGTRPCLINPFGYASTCFDCKLYDGPRPEIPKTMPDHEVSTSWDDPPPEDAIETACAFCGKLFYAPKNKIYCSLSCKKKAYKRRRAARGGEKRKFGKAKCVICGRFYRPHTDNQCTCGGACNKKYMARKYHRGIAFNHPPKRQQSGGSTMETRSSCPVQRMKECVAQIKRHNPDIADISPSSLDALATMLAARLSWWRTLSRPRQAVLLDIAVSYGVHGLLGWSALLSALRASKWEQARQIILNSRYAMMMANSGRGKFSVENARQISTGAWIIIPEYVPEEDDDDEDSWWD